MTLTTHQSVKRGTIATLIAIGASTFAGAATPDDHAGIPEYAAAGTVGFGPQSCLLFHPDDGSTSAALDNTGGFVPGHRVYVQGTFVEKSTLCLPPVVPGIIDNTIYALLEAPGTVAVGPQGCVGVLVDPGVFHAVATIEPFVPGDRVFAVGGIEPESFACFPAQAPFLVDARLDALFDGTGTLAMGPQGCTVFHPDAGGTFVLDDLGGFIPGDRVHVIGGMPADAFGCFPAMIPRIDNATVFAAFEACGTTSIGPQGCPALLAEDGTLFVLDTASPFGFQAHVFVAGFVNPASFACLPFQGPAIENASFAPCFAGDANADAGVDVQAVIPMLDLDDSDGETAMEFLLRQL